MARNRNKMSLYEVIGQSRSKSSFGKTLKKFTPEKTDRDEPTTAKTAIPSSGRAMHWPRKPKIVQFNAGRIEISLPYPLAIAVLLGVVLLVLVALWIGEIGYLSRGRITNSAGKVLTGWRKAVVDGVAGTGEKSDEIPPDTGGDGTEVSTGNNRIVIQTYDKRADLELVQYYFAEGGIETEIRKIGNTFYLVTVNKYEKDPKIAGTDGYAALQRIIKWGARYKAPKGFESFAHNLFSDAYGKRFDD
jgi:hypothetical protein